MQLGRWRRQLSSRVFCAPACNAGEHVILRLDVGVSTWGGEDWPQLEDATVGMWIPSPSGCGFPVCPELWKLGPPGCGFPGVCLSVLRMAAMEDAARWSGVEKFDDDWLPQLNCGLLLLLAAAVVRSVP